MSVVIFQREIGRVSTFITHKVVLTKVKAYNYNLMDVLIKLRQRGVVHELQAPTDMAMNIMEL
jgi:hypothetical protein